MAANLVDQRLKVLFQGVLLKWKKNKLGCPKAPLPVHSWKLFMFGLDAKGYADYHAFSVSPGIDKLTDELNAAAAQLLAWSVANKMSISAP